MEQELIVSELEIGKTYLVKRRFNSKRIIFQPAVYVGTIEAQRNGKATTLPQFKFCFDEAVVAMPTYMDIKPLTKSWLERQMEDRAVTIAELQREASVLLNIRRSLV